MAIRYVDSNAAGLNDGTSWTDAYADIVTALAGAVVADDDVYVASNHSKTYNIATTYSVPDGVTFISVNSGTDAYASGASEIVDNSGSTLDLAINPTTEAGNVVFQGFSFEAEDRLSFGGSAGTKHVLKDFTYHSISTAAGKGMLFSGDGKWFEFHESVFNFSGAGHVLSMSQNAYVILRDCSGSGTLVNGLFTLAGNGRARIDARDTDFTTIIATSGALVNATSASNDGLNIEMHRCKLPTGFVVTSAAWGFKGIEVHITECDQGGGYHYFFHETNEGEMEEDTTTYLNATYDGTNGFSAKVTTTSDASPVNPFRQKLGVLPAQDLSTAQTITVECTSDASLTDNDIWIEVVRNDNTDEALGVRNSTQNTDPLAAGTALTTAGTGTWTSGDTEDYIITYDIGALAAVDNGTVEVYACIGAPSIVANFDLPTIAAT